MKTCEKCGVAFKCGAKTDTRCWCNAYAVTEESLKNIREKYNDCLCEKCLIEMAGIKAKDVR